VPATRTERVSAAQSQSEAKVAERRSETGERGERPQSEPVQDRDQPAPPAQKPAAWLRRHKLLAGLIALAILVAIGAGGAWWLNSRNYESTDDAFIDARPSAISPEVSGAITEVLATDNEVVEPGQVLVKIDPRNYAAAVDEAKASAAQAEAAIATSEAQMAAQQAAINQMQQQLTQAEAALTYSQEEFQRAETLLTKGAGTVQQAQLTRSDLTQKQAALDAARAALAQAQRQLEVIAAQERAAKAQKAQAEAQLAEAEANVARTTIAAPFGGRVTQLTAAKGTYATPGQTLMYIVPADVWVTANFRETQLARMRPGDPAQLCIDAYGRCFPGRVASVQAGSGTAFSLLPAENATGNYVKVVQRVPVKLVFDELPNVELGPGMSVTPSVKVQ